MKKFMMYLLAASGVAILALTITALNARDAGAQQKITVAVPGPTPRPPTPVDIVQSDITLPTFDIDNARQPFQASVRNTFNPCNQPNSYSDSEIIANVPNDKRLVIEYVSGSGGLPGNGGLAGNDFFNLASVDTTVNGAVKNHYLVVNRLGNDNNRITFFGFSQQARLYADPGTTVHVSGHIADCTLGTGVLDVTISGYLVDVAQFGDITP